MRDIYFSYFTTVLAGAVILAYLVRVGLRGRARHSRTDADGGSVFLHKSAMEMAYWLLSPAVNGLAAMKVTPNMITGLSALPALAAGVAAARGWFGLACLLGALSALSDIVDGVLARQTGLSSDAGEVIDSAVDRYGECFLLCGVALYYRANEGLQTMALAALVGSFMVSYTTAKAEACGVPPPRGSMRRAERAVYLLTALGFTGFSRAIVADQAALWIRDLPMMVAIALVGVVTNVSAVRRFAAIVRTLRAREPQSPK
jgi:CDP-diacylglycerol---glycerol-3-phosphate 3-phosphatidyltransferase